MVSLKDVLDKEHWREKVKLNFKVKSRRKKTNLFHLPQESYPDSVAEQRKTKYINMFTHHILVEETVFTNNPPNNERGKQINMIEIESHKIDKISSSHSGLTAVKPSDKVSYVISLNEN